MRVVAVDPGGTTGLAVFDNRSPREHVAWGAPYTEAMKWLEDELSQDPQWRPDLVVCESFTISSNTLRKTQKGSLDAIEQIGISKWLCREAGVPFKLQPPADAKSFATDAKLRAAGWWTPGSDHARDASRHLLVAVCENNPEFLAQVSKNLDT